MGSGNFHGAGKPAQSQSPSPPPCHVQPRVSRRVPGSVCHPCPGIATPPLSPCKAEHWDGQNAPVAPGQDTLAQPGGPRQHLPGPPGCSTFCGPRGDRDVSEQQHTGLLSPCKHRWTWHSPGDAPGLVWVCPGKDTSGGSCLHPCAGCPCWLELHLRAGEKQFQPRARVSWHPLALLRLCPPWGRAASDWGIPHSRQGDSREGVDRPQEQPGVNAHPSAGSCSCCPHSSSVCSICASEGPFQKPGEVSQCQALQRAGVPPCSSCCPGVRLSVPFPPCPSTPHHLSGNGVTCRSFHPSLAPAASHPHPSHHDLVLGYFGEHRGPPSSRPPCLPPWVLLVVAPSPPWEVTVV